MRTRTELVLGSNWGKWTIASPTYIKVMPNGAKRIVVDCKCECDTEKKGVIRGNIVRGLSTSCGACLKISRPEPGDIIGEWRILSVEENHARCECSCGKVRHVYLYTLGTDSRSCGHGNDGRRRSKLRRIWKLMLQRCYLEGSDGWDDYGGRGISVCDEWRNSFEVYYEWAIANNYRMLSGLQIDRIDNDGNYSPENCRITDRKTNARNKRNTRFVTAWGETKALSAWDEDERCKAPYPTVWVRISKGWDPERALSTPPARRGPVPGAKRQTRLGDESVPGEAVQQSLF